MDVRLTKAAPATAAAASNTTPSTAKGQVIRLINAGLQEVNGDVAAHGWLDLESIKSILVDDYQREVLNLSMGGRGQGQKSSLAKAIEAGERLPDIMLAMRGQRFHSRGDDMFLEDKVYVVDGLQRISNMMKYAEKYPEEAKELRIGAEVRFGTTKEYEKDLFIKLNAGAYKVPLSPNVILRNSRDKHSSLLTLYGLSTNTPSFPLYGKVQWNQRRERGQLLTALMLGRISGLLHRRFSTITTGAARIQGGAGGARASDMGSYLDRNAAMIGLKNYRANMETFFEFIDQAWGLRKIEYRELAVQTKSNFLLSVAGILSDHDNFWDGKSLEVPVAWVRKFASFPSDAPEVVRLAGAGSMALPMLYTLIRDHLNKGKRTNKLHSHKKSVVDDTEE